MGLAVYLFAVLTVLYGGQLVIAAHRGYSEDVPSENERTTLFRSFSTFDGGAHNTWIFILLAFLFPVFLTSLVNVGTADLSNMVVSPIGVQDTPDQATETDTTNDPRPPGSAVYYLCFACVCVLMTLEFSYLHSLRNHSRQWTSMMLAALVLDLMTLLVLLLVVRPPISWESPMSSATLLSVVVASIAAVISSLFVLILSRVAAEVHERRLVFQASGANPSNGDSRTYGEDA